ncbi:glycosyltransferase family 39 protein [Nodosilinea sp. LEGE 07088]|uniref:ArnT family glycosyltransferase n=1 Tax=Nodosilinea sp. LEGE 07088 TaxID=2777968 RepID=UPI0018801B8C|nr:glycosyltransferase family 39 protein [Nodosilinea sp. LEGE 07088]MBE9137189.1 glycosyltransferase family 39 protein [Nodosilinea sp. LEGE 07088]
MFAFLPLVSFGFIFLILNRNKKCCRENFLLSSVIVGTSLTLITELLSLGSLLTFGWLLGWWISISVALGGIYLYSTKKNSYRVWTRRWLCRINITNKESRNLLEHRLKIQLLGIIFIVGAVGLIALMAPPNVNDALGYHMPRVMHWIQNRNVAHFPTNYTAQLFLSPWANYVILHLQILNGGDYYANFVQWFCMIGSILGVSLIAQQLGGNIYGQVFASVFCSTLPMGVVQGSSSQNDYVAAFWLVCLAYYGLKAVKTPPEKANFLLVGLSLGLAILSKGTAYLYAFPFLVWLFVLLIRSLRLGVYKPAYQVALPALLINLPLFVRNFEIFQHPLGKSPDYIIYTNKAISISILGSNIIRNLALQFSTPSPSINRFFIEKLSSLYSFLGWDINDPLSTSGNFQLNSLINHGDFAGNPFHLLLIITSAFCLGLGYFYKKLHNQTLLLNYILCILSGFLLFCLLLAWTPFHNRLHLPLFVLSSAFVGCVLSDFWGRRIVHVTAIALIIAALPWILFDENKPLVANSHFLKTGKIENIFNVNRLDLYFIGRPDIKESMIRAVDFIKSQQCPDIGMSFDRLDVYEYPLWVLLNSSANQYRLEHVDVDNPSVKMYSVQPFKGFQPCLLYDTYYGKEKIQVQGLNYARGFSSPPINVLAKAD